VRQFFFILQRDMRARTKTTVVSHSVGFDFPGRGIHRLRLAGLRWRVFSPVIKCGQQSLEVFCVGIFLSFVAHFILETTLNEFPAQIFLGVGGLCVMTAGLLWILVKERR
jgi:hypothetical protein